MKMSLNKTFFWKNFIILYNFVIFRGAARATLNEVKSYFTDHYLKVENITSFPNRDIIEILSEESNKKPEVEPNIIPIKVSLKINDYPRYLCVFNFPRKH